MNAIERVETQLAHIRSTAKMREERGEPADPMVEVEIGRLQGELESLREIDEGIRPIAEAAKGREQERVSAGKINLDDLRRQQGQEEMEQFRQTQRNLWLQHGGEPEEFEANWPQIKAEYVWEKSQAAYADVRSPFDR